MVKRPGVIVVGGTQSGVGKTSITVGPAVASIAEIVQAVTATIMLAPPAALRHSRLR